MLDEAKCPKFDPSEPELVLVVGAMANFVAKYLLVIMKEHWNMFNAEFDYVIDHCITEEIMSTVIPTIFTTKFRGVEVLRYQ